MPCNLNLTYLIHNTIEGYVRGTLGVLSNHIRDETYICLTFALKRASRRWDHGIKEKEHFMMKFGDFGHDHKR